MLHEKHPRVLPRRPGQGVDIGAYRETRRESAVVDRERFQRAPVTLGHQLIPDLAEVRRTGPQHTVDASRPDVAEAVECALSRKRSQAFAVDEQLGAMPLRLLRPPFLNGVYQEPARGQRLLLVCQERDPAGQEGVLGGHDRGVAVVHELDTARGGRRHPSGSGGRDDDQRLALESLGALQFPHQDVGALLGGVGGFQARVHPDGFLGLATVHLGQLVGA